MGWYDILSKGYTKEDVKRGHDEYLELSKRKNSRFKDAEFESAYKRYEEEQSEEE